MSFECDYIYIEVAEIIGQKAGLFFPNHDSLPLSKCCVALHQPILDKETKCDAKYIVNCAGCIAFIYCT